MSRYYHYSMSHNVSWKGNQCVRQFKAIRHKVTHRVRFFSHSGENDWTTLKCSSYCCVTGPRGFISRQLWRDFDLWPQPWPRLKPSRIPQNMKLTGNPETERSKTRIQFMRRKSRKQANSCWSHLRQETGWDNVLVLNHDGFRRTHYSIQPNFTGTCEAAENYTAGRESLVCFCLNTDEAWKHCSDLLTEATVELNFERIKLRERQADQSVREFS